MLSQPLLDSGRLGLVILNPDQTITACYGKLIKWLTPGPKATEVIPPLVGLDDVLEQIAGGSLAAFSLPRMTWHGMEAEDCVLSLEIMPSPDSGHLQIVFRDETETATLEQEVVQQRNELSLAYDALNEAKERVEQALYEKTALLANVSHDLKTPLQVIMGNAEILKGDLPEQDRESFLQDIVDNSTFLLTLITDLLDASAIEAAQIELSEEPVDVNRMLGKILSMAERLPGGASRRFELKTDDDPVVIQADAMRLQRLLLNIVSNAVKFTDENGHVAVQIRKTDAGDLKLEIKDDGCGIEPELIGRVFEPFERSGNAEGTGLGLHIAKGLAALHDADLSLSSRPGVGTTATLCLPKSRVVDSSS